MKIAITGRKTEEIKDQLKKHKIEIVEKNPNFVFSHGGDGAFLFAENKYPEIPKLILRENSICKLCDKRSNSTLINLFLRNKFNIEENIKVEAIIKGKKLIATNDITLHNADPRHAIRYKTKINNKLMHEKEIIGDGIVVSTPLGSTGYYRSITDSIFYTGIGLAFNNSTEAFDHMVLKDDSIIEIEITRGPAYLFADNQERKVKVNEGEKIQIQKSSKLTRLVKVF
jgi:NAD kinase